MTKSDPLLTLKLDGPEVQTGRMPVDELTLVLKKVQLCVKRLGQVLLGEVSAAKPGRLKGEIEAACNLDVVAVEGGSFVIGLDLPADQQPQITLFGKQEPLGKAAIEKLLEGLELLGKDEPRLVNEFDYGVLVALREVARVLDRGVERVCLSYRGNGAPPRVTMLNSKVRARVLENITGTIKSAVEVKGTLREVNLERHTCQIFPASGGYIACSFEDDHEPIIKESLDFYVIATGEATLRETDGRIKEMRVQDIEVFEQPPDLSPAQPSLKPLTARALLESGLVGMWKDRTDIGDSAGFARQLRERAQKREWE
jgi:hypothetical protein